MLHLMAKHFLLTIVGWLNLLGQVSGVASTEFALSRMIWAAVISQLFKKKKKY